jgi:hypothetical protein
MKIPRKNLLLLLLLSVAFSSRAQTPATDSIFYGFKDFVLGSDKEYFGDRIQLTDSFTYKGVTDYHYVHRFSTPLEIAGISFLDAILTFNKSNKLKEIVLTRLYTERLFTNHKAKASKDQQNLYHFLVSQSGNKGKKKSKFNSLKAPGYEWRKNGVQLWNYLQTSTQLHTTAKEIYFISLEWRYIDLSK